MPATGITPATLDEILVKLEKQLGKGSIHRGDQVEDVYRLPFHSPNLNHATGGGIPFGRFTQFWGARGVMKTRLAYELIAQAQQIPHSVERYLDPRIRHYRAVGDEEQAARLEEELEFYRERFPDGLEVAFYNAEQQFDKAWAARLGVDVKRLILVESTMIEDIVGAMEATYRHIPMHVVDSTTNATSYEEQNMKMTDRRVGLDARVWKQTLRKSLRFWNRPNGVDEPPENFNIGLLITQASTYIKTGGEQPVTARYISHTSSMTIHFQRGRFLWRMEDGQLKEDKPAGADDRSLAGRAVPDGVTIFGEIEKSRVGRMGRIAALQADFKSKGFDLLWELTNAAIYFGIAIKSGSRYTVDGDEKSVNGLKGLRARVDEDPGLQDRIYAELMRSLED